jgi:lipid II:glycine glycyltransferase (peptidoglycan interpeptide bridge formation enzyme)
LILRSLEKADPLVCRDAASFLQSCFWGSFKARFGWKVFAFLAAWTPPPQAGEPAEPARVLPLLVLYRRLGPAAFAYVPWGPELPPPSGPPPQAEAAGEYRTAALEELAPALGKALPPDTAFIRFDLPWPSADADVSRNNPRLFGKTLRRAAADVQPPDTVIVDLSGSEQELLARMKSKWRYNIGLAEKKAVKVRQGGPEELPSFYRLYRETAGRDGIAIHGMGYYQTLFELAAGGEEGVRLYLASHDGEDIAGIITLFRKEEAVYLYGASANHKRSLMAPYALQWQAIRDAKAAGCAFYDLYGIPPNDDPDHPMAGLFRFKTGFGGTIIHRPGSWDYARKPVVTALYHALEAGRKKLRDLKKRRKKRPRQVNARETVSAAPGNGSTA